MPLEMTPRELAELIDRAVENRLLDLFTGSYGVVESYDATTQTANVKPATKRAYPKSDGDTNFVDPPIVPNCPVGWPIGGGFYLALPVNVGDTVHLAYHEQSTAPFRDTASVMEPGDLRRHSSGSALAIPCNPISARKLAEAPASEATEALFIVPTGGTLRVSQANQGSLAQAVMVIDGFMAALDAAVLAVAAAPVSVGVGGASAAFEAFKTTFAGLQAAVASTVLKAQAPPVPGP